MAQIYSSILHGNPQVDATRAHATTLDTVLDQIHAAVGQCKKSQALVLDLTAFESLPLADVATALTTHRLKQPFLVVLSDRAAPAADLRATFSGKVRQVCGVGPLYIPSGNAPRAGDLKQVIDALGSSAVAPKHAGKFVDHVRNFLVALRDGKLVVDGSALRQHFPAEALRAAGYTTPVFLVDPDFECDTPIASPGTSGLRLASKGGTVGMDRRIFAKAGEWDAPQANVESFIDCIYGQSTILDLTDLRTPPAFSKETLKALHAVTEIHTTHGKVHKYAKEHFKAKCTNLVKDLRSQMKPSLADNANRALDTRQVDRAAQASSAPDATVGPADPADVLNARADDELAHRPAPADRQPTRWHHRVAAKLGAWFNGLWRLLFGERAAASDTV